MDINSSKHGPYELPSNPLVTGKRLLQIYKYVLQSFKNIYPTDFKVLWSEFY